MGPKPSGSLVQMRSKTAASIFAPLAIDARTRSGCKMTLR
jgi:hypothetical protein